MIGVAIICIIYAVAFTCGFYSMPDTNNKVMMALLGVLFFAFLLYPLIKYGN